MTFSFRTHQRFFVISTLLLIALLTLAPLAWAQEAPSSRFSDVPTQHRYERSINALAEEGIIQGFPIGTFLPEREINRVEALKIILETFDVPAINQENTLTFTDIDQTAWYFPYIEKAIQNNIVQGYEDNTFRPNATLNRAEALKIIVQVIDTKKELNQNPLEIPPALDIPTDSWFAPYFQYGLNQGLIYLDQNENLNPGTLVTRGELSDIIYRLKHPGTYSGLVYYGNASYYADKFEGRNTSSGEPFDQSKLTAAHRTFPFGTTLRVTNQKTGETTEVKVNDRGPYSDHALIDLSKAAFDAIAHLGSGIIPVEIEVIYDNPESP